MAAGTCSPFLNGGFCAERRAPRRAGLTSHTTANIAIKQDMAEPDLARPCHDVKETVGNVLVPFVCVLVMGVEQPAVVSVTPSDTELL